MKPTIIIGIDPGLDGGIATIYGGGDIGVSAMPSFVKQPNKKRLFDEDTISDLLWGDHAENTFHAFVEKAQAMPNQGCVSMFNYGVGFGLLRGVLAAYKMPYTLVPPRTWQKHFGISGKKGNTKAQSIAIAKELFPDVNLFRTPRCKKEHDGMADSLLIAEYGRQTL